MKKCRYSTVFIIVFTMLFNTCTGVINPSITSYAYTERSASVNASSLNVRSNAGTSNSIVAKLSRGTAVTVIGEKNASDGALWYEIRFSGANGTTITGYASQSYIKFPVTYNTDSSFESYLSSQGFPESYKIGLRQIHAEYPNWVFKAQNTNLDWNTVIENESIVGRNLVYKNSVSSWKSTESGAYNWDTSTWPGFDGSSWQAASSDIIRYYMDPRNFLDTTNVFQFLVQSYDGNLQTRAGLESMISGTFLSGGSGSSNGSGSSSNNNSGTVTGPGAAGPGETTSVSPAEETGSGSSAPVNNSAPTGSNGGASLQSPQASISRNFVDRVTSNYGPGMTGSPGSSSGNSQGNSSGGTYMPPSSGSSSYVDIILNAASGSGVNPYVLASMILQEQGNDGKSGSISGSVSGYEGHYNFFNIEAYASGSLTAVQRGLWYASQSGNYGRPWNTVEKSILGGSVYYGDNYVKVGQDTFYLKKFNVQGSNLYKHQYMTNVQGAAGEAEKLASAYTADLKNTALEFKIPIFNNMPDNASSKPLGDGNPNNKLSNLSVDGFNLTPTFNRDVTEYDLIVDTSVSDINVQASVLDASASVSGSGHVSLQSGNNVVNVSITAQNGTVRVYKINVVRQGNGPVNNGSSSGTGSSGGQSGPGGTTETAAQAPAVQETSGSSIVVSPVPDETTAQAPAQTTASPETTAPVQTTAPAQTAADSSRGDINGDGSITILDVVKLQRHVLGVETLPAEQQSAADMNGDGKLDVKDITLIQKTILGV